MAITGGPNAAAEQQGTGARVPTLTEMIRSCNTQSGWAGNGQEYITQIRTKMEDPAIQTKATMFHISDNAVAFNTPEKQGVVLVHESDIMNLQGLANESKLYAARDAYFNSFAGHKLLNIVTCNKFMFDRPQQMASYLSRVFMAQTASIQSFNVNSFGSNLSINIDTDMANVRQFFDVNSTTPVFCGSFGFIASIVDKTNRNAQYVAPIPMFGVTGYVEFIRNDANGIFTPVVHITDILSVLATPKILALALPLIGEVVISRNLWRQPFTAIAKDSGINLGNLIIDENQKPVEVKTDADFRMMFRQYIGMPLLCIDVKAGGADVPGVQRLIRTGDHGGIVKDVYEFFNETQIPMIPAVSQNIFHEIIGAVDTTKTKFATYMDTRDITYLYAVSKLKYAPRLDYLLTRNDFDPIRRFENIREFVGEIVPTHSSVTALLLDNFLKDIVSRLASKVKVDMPTTADMPAIDMNEFTTRAYQPGMTMFGQSSGGSFNAGGWYSA